MLVKILKRANLKGCGIFSSTAENVFIIGGSNNHELRPVIQLMVFFLYDGRLYI